MKSLTTQFLSTCLFGLLTFASTSHAADFTSAEFSDAYQKYLSVSNDEGGSAKKLARQWQTLYEADSENPFTLVILGSSHTLMGRDALMPWSKMKHTEQGLDEMALAVRMLNDTHREQMFEHMSVDLHVRTTSAITFSQVPEFFGRHEDAHFLFEDVLSDAAFQAMPAEAKTYIYYFAISAALQVDKNSKAEAWKSQLAELNVNDEYTTAALALK